MLRVFTAALRVRLIEKSRVFTKKSVARLVEEIRYQHRQRVVKGCDAA